MKGVFGDMRFSLEKGYTGEIVVSENFLSEKMNELEYDELKVYLKICLLSRHQREADLSHLAHLADVDPTQMLYIMSALEKKGLIKVSKSGVRLVGSNAEPKKSLNPDEFSDKETDDVKIIAQATEKAFGKLLSHGDLNSIMGIYKFIGLDKEVFVLAVEYCCSLGIKKFNYIEKTLITWKEAGITDAISAHEYLRTQEENAQYYNKLKKNLGLSANLTKKQMEFADKWRKDFTFEQIVEACEKTVDGTGKISFPHTDKVLYNPDYQYQGQKQGGGKIVKSTGFTNFDQRKADYEAQEKRNLENLLKRKKGD